MQLGTAWLLLLLLLSQTLICTVTRADEVTGISIANTALLESICTSHICGHVTGQFQLAPALLVGRICFHIWRDHTAERRDPSQSSLQYQECGTVNQNAQLQVTHAGSRPRVGIDHWRHCALALFCERLRCTRVMGHLLDRQAGGAASLPASLVAEHNSCMFNLGFGFP